MDKLIFASLHPNAGKTSLITGIAKVLNKKIGYLKPFGDRSFFHKKRLWDYDSALINSIFSLNEDLANITIGIEHSKVRYVYDEKRVKEKLNELVNIAKENCDILFVEGGKDLSYGSSVYMDSISISKYIQGKLILVLSGDLDTILDDITWIIRNINLSNNELAGIIINKIDDLEDFEDIYLDDIKAMGVPVLGTIPYNEELIKLSMKDLSGFLFARILAGDNGLNNKVDCNFVGVMTVEAAINNSNFQKKNKLVITTADREDLIMTALDDKTSGIILTNNIMPAEPIIAKANEQNIPILLVPIDTYEVEKKINTSEPLLTKDSHYRITLLEELIQEHIYLEYLTN